jgi:hypothetical protein
MASPSWHHRPIPPIMLMTSAKPSYFVQRILDPPHLVLLRGSDVQDHEVRTVRPLLDKKARLQGATFLIGGFEEDAVQKSTEEIRSRRYLMPSLETSRPPSAKDGRAEKSQK